MSKTERQLYGSAADDTAPIEHFGNVSFDADLNRGKVWPIWLRIDTWDYRHYACHVTAQMANPDERGGWRKTKEEDV